jgi:hypothetical protein
MIGRPTEAEAAPYYFTYINLVPEEDILNVLEMQLEESRGLLGMISEEQSGYRYAPEKWSIRQLLNHLSDAERTAAFRALWFARGFESSLPSFDQSVAADGAKADGITWAAHQEEFRRIRLSTISLFQNLPTEAWLFSGMASDNRFTVRSLAYIIAGHFRHHATVLRERYLTSLSKGANRTLIEAGEAC